jgi:hypothetical protein
MTSPNQVTAHNAGWRSSAVATLWRDRQFRFAGSAFWPGVCEFQRSAQTRTTKYYAYHLERVDSEF